MDSRMTASWGWREVRGWEDWAKRKKDSWTRTTVCWLLGGGGIRGLKGNEKKYHKIFLKNSLLSLTNPFKMGLSPFLYSCSLSQTNRTFHSCTDLFCLPTDFYFSGKILFDSTFLLLGKLISYHLLQKSNLPSIRGVQPFGISGLHWKKSCLGSYIKYTNSNEDQKKGFKKMYDFVLGRIHSYPGHMRPVGLRTLVCGSWPPRVHIRLWEIMKHEIII